MRHFACGFRTGRLPRGRTTVPLAGILLLLMSSPSLLTSPIHSGPIGGLPRTPSASSDPGHCLSGGCERSSAVHTAVLSFPPPIPPTISAAPGEAYLSNWSAQGNIAVDPTDPAHWITAGASFADPAVGNGSIVNASGLVFLGDSYDSGATWSVRIEAPAPAWSDPASPECGYRQLLASDVVVRADGVGLVAAVAAPLLTANVTCPFQSQEAPVYVTLDHGPNATGDAPLRVTSPAEGSPHHPRLALAPDGTVYLSYHFDNGSAVVRRSLDGGLSWGPPRIVSAGSISPVALAVNGTGGLNALYYGPGPSSTNLVTLSRSSDGGATFSSNVTVGSIVPPFSASPADIYPLWTDPQIAIDLNASSQFAGRLYAVWSNGSGAAPGSPALQVMWSADSGRTWTSSATVDRGSGHEDIQPAVAVEPNGVVVVQWYGLDSTNGIYRLFGSSSYDGGATFSTSFAISHVDSHPPNLPAGPQEFVGDRTVLVRGPSGLASIWTDTRSSLAVNHSFWKGVLNYGSFVNSSLWTAGILSVSIASTDPVAIGVQGSLDAGASLSASSTPTGALVAEHGSLVLSAPPTIANGTSTRYFASWFGSTYSTNATLALEANGPIDLVACYAATAHSVCRAPGAPGFLRILGTPLTAQVLLDGRPFDWQQSTGFTTIAPGSHTLRATSPGYYPLQLLVLIDPGSYVNASFALGALPAPIDGSVTPVTALVLVDGVGIPVRADGSFSANVSEGNHSVDLSEYGYLPFSIGPVFLAWDHGLHLSVHLQPMLAEIYGVISPADASVSLNGVSQPVRPDGTFALGVPVGIYWLNASEGLYESRSYGPLSVLPLGTYFVNLTLPRLNGTLSVGVSPASAFVQIDGGSPVVLPGGHRVLTLPWGTHTLQGSAPGFSPRSATLDVPYNATASVTLNLTVAPGWVDAILEPGTAALSFDGSPLAPGTDGSFNATTSPGDHRIVASADGFLTASLQLIVAPGRPTLVWLNLTSALPTNPPLTLDRLLPGLALVLGVVGAVALVFAVSARRPAAPRAGAPG